MELTDIMVKDSEGIVIYRANRDDGGSWDTIVKGYFDKDEDVKYINPLRTESQDVRHISTSK